MMKESLQSHSRCHADAGQQLFLIDNFSEKDAVPIAIGIHQHETITQ